MIPADPFLKTQPNGAVLEAAGGRQGHRKASWMVALILPRIQGGLDVLILSEKMEALRQLQKVLEPMAPSTGRQVRCGDCIQAQRLQLVAAPRSLQERFQDRVWINHDPYSADALEGPGARHKPDGVVDDFIQHSVMGETNARMDLKRFMEIFSQVAKQYQVAMVVFSHPSRGIAYRENPYPMTRDLAGSAALGQIPADLVTVRHLHKMTRPRKFPMDRISLICAKRQYRELPGRVQI